jgi:Flp pilus assembly protein TadD
MADDAGDAHARARLGLIALWENRLDVAESLLEAASAADTTNRELRAALAEVYYRQKRFDRASAVQRALGRPAAAAQLAALPAPSVASAPPTGVRAPTTSPG